MQKGLRLKLFRIFISWDADFIQEELKAHL